MASFMTTRSQIIFRRFDDVHVKLLLCLQDEISQLEQELSVLEEGSAGGGEKTSQQMRIMRELRRVVAEYGENQVDRRLHRVKANRNSRSHVRKLVIDANEQN
jgi:hypothetical protein